MQTTEPTSLTLSHSTLGEYSFKVTIGLGEWSSERRVTITDPGVDPAEIVRQIAKGRTSVTDSRLTSGDVIVEWNGHAVWVGTWADDGRSVPPVDLTIDFKFRDASGDVAEVDEVGIESLNVEVVPAKSRRCR